jgi:hypothetical protein
MLELVVPDSLAGHDALDDDRLTPVREMVGRQVFSFDGAPDEARALAATLSQAGGPPVLLNDVTDQTPETRTVDVYMYRDGEQKSGSMGVQKPRPDDDEA